jgi:hypothetical protein
MRERIKIAIQEIKIKKSQIIDYNNNEVGYIKSVLRFLQLLCEGIYLKIKK